MSLLALIDELEHLLDLAEKEQPADLPASLLFEATARLDRIASRSTAQFSRCGAAYDASGDWEVEGHRSAADAIKSARHRSAKHCTAAIRLGRDLRTMPLTDAAFLGGRITGEHAHVLARANRPELPFAEAEELLVGFAAELSFRDFVKAVKYWEQVAAPTDADDEAEAKQQRREAHASRTIDGMGKVDAWLEPLGFTEFHNELRRLEKVEFDIDWEEGTRLHGPAVRLDQLSRTPAQRRADALVEMARRSAGVDTPRNRRPTVVIHADAATFEAATLEYFDLPHTFPINRTCELDDGTVITPAEMLEQALRGHVRRVVWQSPGVLLDVGREQRFFSGELREALCLRDRSCRHPSCDLPASDCDADHVIEWQHRGTTAHDNGVMLCRYHHRRKRRISYPPPPGAP